MKHQPLAPSTLRPLLLGLALAASPTFAQQATPPPAAPASAPLPTPSAGPKLLSHFDIAETTIGKVAEQLADLSGINILVSNDVKKLTVPGMRLRNVTDSGVLQAIARSGVPILVTPTPAEAPGEAPVWVIQGVEGPSPAPIQTKIFNLRNSVARATLPEQVESSQMFQQITKEISDAVLTALEARAEVTQIKSDAPVIKVHESTRLIIVSGKPAEVDIARQVICLLGGQPVD